MTDQLEVRKIAILGAGPSGLFLYKRLIESGNKLEISIFEKKQQFGTGMPYSTLGANIEHVTNVSDNEIPALVTSIEDWVKTAPAFILNQFEITPENFNAYKVLPRLFFGVYLSAQFELLHEEAKKLGIITNLYAGATVIDIADDPKQNKVAVNIAELGVLQFDKAVVCTGHYWPKQWEGKIEGYFDSPYPPIKLNLKLNHAVAIQGSSLTAIDAIRTLARCNGTFLKDEEGFVSYQLATGSERFKLVMHSRNGLLPAVRIHLADSHLSGNLLLTAAEMQQYKDANNGFLSLDYLFEKNFKEIFKVKDPAFYEKIEDLNLEDFVAMIMDTREKLDPFQLLYAEYKEAEKSIKRKQSVYWKEMLAILSVSMNYPAKYLPAEDMLRLQQVLMPLIAVVIAFIPQGSCRELMALHQAGVLDIVEVGDDSEVLPAEEGAIYRYKDKSDQEKQVHFQTFVNCTGQPHLSYEQFPFKSLKSSQSVRPARLRFKDPTKAVEALAHGNEDVEVIDGHYYLRVPGIAINDYYQLVDEYGAFNDRIFMMAVPYIGGFNPDYSGLDFCSAASTKIAEKLTN